MSYGDVSFQCFVTVCVIYFLIYNESYLGIFLFKKSKRL